MVVGCVGSLAKGRHPIRVAPNEPARPGRCADRVVAALRDRVRVRAAVTPEHRWERGADRIADSAATQDVWCVLARAGTDDVPRTLATAQDAVFRRYLPMARTLANGAGDGSRPVDPADAERAAELGLAQAVLGWRRPDSSGFEAFARAAIAAQLRRLSTADPADLPPGGRPTAGEEPSPDPGSGGESRFPPPLPGRGDGRAQGGYSCNGRQR